MECSGEDVVRAAYGVLGGIEDMGVSLLDLGLVYDVRFEGGRLTVVLGVVAPLCALCAVPTLNMWRVYQELGSIPCVADVDVRLSLDPPWTPERMAPHVRDRVRQILSEVAKRFGVAEQVGRVGTAMDSRVRVHVQG